MIKTVNAEEIAKSFQIGFDEAYNNAESHYGMFPHEKAKARIHNPIAVAYWLGIAEGIAKYDEEKYNKFFQPG